MRNTCYIIAIFSSAILVFPITIMLYYTYEHFKEVLGNYNGLIFVRDIFILTVLGIFIASLISFISLCRGVR